MTAGRVFFLTVAERSAVDPGRARQRERRAQGLPRFAQLRDDEVDRAPLAAPECQGDCWQRITWGYRPWCNPARLAGSG